MTTQNSNINPNEIRIGRFADIRVDVAATDTSGQRFIVELQLARQEAFYERAIFNSSFAVQQQVKRGNLSYDFPPVYFIGIMDFSIHKGSDEVLYRYALRRKEDGELMSDRPAPAEQSELLARLFDSAEIATFTADERNKYLNDMTTQRDIINQIAYAKKEGHAAGVAEGEIKENESIARNLKKRRMNPEEIAEITGLSPEAISAL